MNSESFFSSVSKIFPSFINTISSASIKKAQVEELAQRNHLKLRVGDVLTAKNTTHYRNKVIVGFAKNKGKVYSGLYAAKSHRVVACQNCMMHPDIVNKIIVKIEELVSSMKIELYNEKTRTGLLRHTSALYLILDSNKNLQNAILDILVNQMLYGVRISHIYGRYRMVLYI